MKIGFDVSDLCADRADGTTRYTRELARRLPGLDGEHSWLYFAPCQATLAPLGEVEWVASQWPKWWTQTRLPWDLWKIRPDILFMPIQQIPSIRPRGVRTVAVVHDLAVHIYPEQFTPRDRLLLRVFSAQVARSADHIIAVSQATANDVNKYYRRTRNVYVVHHGVDHQIFRVPTPEEALTSWATLTKHYRGLLKPYLLYVGQIQPRKNLVRLIEAFDRLAAQERTLRLVIAGSHGWLQKTIHERIARSPYKDRIILTDRVPDELLPALYWHAEVFVLPSLYEGFGMPVLEAMACGCPVVTSSVSSLPEVVGDAAMLVDPLNINAIVTGIREARSQRAALIARGHARAQQFTWERTARATLSVITHALT
jgi:glycosyltransferase involved in cell wall biosynthesis